MPAVSEGKKKDNYINDLKVLKDYIIKFHFIVLCINLF